MLARRGKDHLAGPPHENVKSYRGPLPNSRVNGSPPFISACQGLYELTLKINMEEDGDSFFGF